MIGGMPEFEKAAGIGVREFFAEVLPAAFENYEPREGQLQMALAVERAIRQGTHAVVEAPTGTGKSVAAVAPAVLEGVHGERRKTVVVATANIALQTQYVGKDLPQLKALLEPHGLGFSFAIAKGIGNYLCLRDLEDSDASGLGAADAAQYREIEDWARSTAKGDLEELSFTPSPVVRLRVTTDAEECTGRACPKKDSCHALRARTAYKAADVIVTNYHLLYLDAVIAGGGGEGLLPKYEVLVLDECFVAGTLVDGRPIEEIRVGDEVTSYDEASGVIVRRRVVRRFVSKPSALIRVQIGDEAIVCTPGHPFLTPTGWVAAASLNVGDLVLSSNHAPDPGTDELHDLRDSDRLGGDIGPWAKGEGAEQGAQAGSSLLLGSMLRERASALHGQARGFRRGASREFAAHEGTQPDAVGCYTRPSRDFAQGDRSPAAAAKRERNRAYGCAGEAVGAVGRGLGSGASGTARQAATGDADLLQDRYRQSNEFGRGRSGWVESSGACAEGGGRTQGRDAPLARVERVEVLEPGSDGRYGGVCPDGLVYNLEVEGTHTYTVGSGLIVHNCHKAGDIARDYFGFQITRGAVARATRLLAPRASKKRLPTIDADLHERLRLLADELWRSLEVLRRSRAYKARLRAAGLVKSEPLEDALLETSGLFGQAAKATQDREYRARLEKASGRCSAIAVQLRAARELAQPGAQVYHLDQMPGGGITLGSKLIDVAPVLREKFWDKLDTVVATSATLCDGRGSFSLVDRDVGVPEAAERLQVESPFDHARCLVVVPEGMPDPRSEGFAAAVAEKLLRTVQLAGGRTLALFTSYRVMEVAYQRLARARLPFAVMKQKDAPRMELVRRFKADETSVLLGTESFWAGVDVPGPSLSVVFIDKLPFVTPEDPVVDAVAEADPKGWFHEWSLPRAVVQLRQGAGRLMRARTDYGAVVICDPRVTTAAYGSRFLQGFPEGVQVTTDLEEVGAWLSEHAEVA